MITTIVLDLGGVLFAEGKVSAVNSFKEKGLDYQKIGSLLSSPLSKDLRRGKVSDEEFWSYVKTQLPVDYDTEYIKQEWYNSYTLDEDVKNLVLKLKPHYKLAVFSGTIKSRVEYLDSKYNYRQLFDVEVYSYDCGHTKPSTEFVKYMIEKVGCPPSEIFYIDDTPDHAEVARPFGVNIGYYSRNRGYGLAELIKQMQECELYAPEVLANIFSHLDFDELITSLKVCKAWSLAINKNPQLFWWKHNTSRFVKLSRIITAEVACDSCIQALMFYTEPPVKYENCTACYYGKKLVVGLF